MTLPPPAPIVVAETGVSAVITTVVETAMIGIITGTTETVGAEMMKVLTQTDPWMDEAAVVIEDETETEAIAEAKMVVETIVGTTGKVQDHQLRVLNAAMELECGERLTRKMQMIWSNLRGRRAKRSMTSVMYAPHYSGGAQSSRI